MRRSSSMAVVAVPGPRRCRRRSASAVSKHAVSSAVRSAGRLSPAAGVVLVLAAGLAAAASAHGASALLPWPDLGLIATAPETPGLGLSQNEKSVDRLFWRTMKALTGSAAETVKFEVYTRKEPSSPVRIFARDKESIAKSTLDPKKPTKFIIHGFWSHQGPGSGGELIKNAFLAVEDCNVVTVDWHDADTLEYGSAVSRSVPKVGAELAELIRAVQGLGGDLKDVHVVGHSLGAQIAGAAGSEVLGPAGAGRITGLDPAGPSFEGVDPEKRLDPTDAGFVDAIHTDGGRLGIVAPTAHVDFFPEGGMHPFPGCGRDTFGLCSHCLAFAMLADALAKPGEMVFRACESWEVYLQGGCEDGATAVMGLTTDPSARGSFFLSTNSTIPEDILKIGKKDASAFPLGSLLGDSFRC